MAVSYDPASSNTVAATWMDNTGVSSSDSNSSDTRNQGLLLSKTSAASNQAQAGVVIRDVEGMSITELGYDIRNGGQCTATTPRFAIVTTDEVVHKAGCTAGTSHPAPAAGWKRLRFDPANPAQMNPPDHNGQQGQECLSADGRRSRDGRQCGGARQRRHQRQDHRQAVAESATTNRAGF